MDSASLDWEAVDRLRGIFLAARKSPADYWRSRADLEVYERTFAQRVAWKWDAVLRELGARGWQPPADGVLDWGCGSGIAGRRVRDFFFLPRLQVFDRSRLAREYATEAGRAEPWRDDGGPIGVLVVSHVWNELADRDRRRLLAVAGRAAAVLWVEPGTYADSRALIAVREILRDTFHVVAPCPHQAACGILAPENERHWCHFFADPPPHLLADSEWVRFAQRVGIDLRSLPYSFLVLERRALGAVAGRTTRIIGAPRIYKAYVRVLQCAEDGVREVEVRQRDDPERFKRLKKGRLTT